MDSTGRIEEESEGGDVIVALDGPVIEVFYGAEGLFDRRHVKHVDISFASHRGQETMMIGSRLLKSIADSRRNEINIVDEHKDRINALVREAIARGGAEAGPQTL
jgi:hypothetical protein